MRVITRKRLQKFWQRRSDAEGPLKAWYEEAKHAVWQTPQDIKNRYRSASFPGNDRVVFNICGGKYRLVVLVQYPFETVLVRFIGTHAEYDRTDARKV